MPDQKQWRQLSRYALRSALSSLPAQMRQAVYEHMLVSIPESLPEQLSFKIAQTQDELEQAFAILHDAYIEQGFASPHASGMRVTLHQAIPSTTILIAKLGDCVVGTVSLTRREHLLGLPLEKVFDLSAVCMPKTYLCEISSLAIAKEFRQDYGGQIFYPLIRMLFRYGYDYARFTHFVVAISPKDKQFYESIFGFRQIPGAFTKDYYGAPAIAMVGDLKQLIKSRNGYKATKIRPAKSIHSYFLSNTSMENFSFPNRVFCKTWDPVMTPSLLDYFFNQKTNVFANANEKELTALWQHYRFDPAFMNILPDKVTGNITMSPRRHRRYPVYCDTIMIKPGFKSVSSFNIDNVSLYGCGGYITEAIPDKSVDAIISVGEDKVAKIKLEPIWRNELGYCGFKVNDASEKWLEFIGHLENDFVMQPAELISRNSDKRLIAD